ncbi:DinB family protein [Thalassobacillus pellis]|uniref:DinB family protein n=1 Tax=Thalassobacillus pellis TaxID=748008 RepID=UPI001961D09C|nr:DinB family protein [Thalassobacillus pellis]MBM7553643.1 putative damage-inducible protein DinB [Thalassobacillus pellis]
MYGLDQRRQKVLNFLNEITDEQARMKPDKDNWSILELLEHLYLIERTVADRIKRAITEGEEKSVPEKPVHHTANRTLKMEAPESLRPKGLFQSVSEAKESLVESRESLELILINYEKATLKRRVMHHMAFGDLSLEQWVEFIGWHELRHLEQMKEVLQKVNRG